MVEIKSIPTEKIVITGDNPRQEFNLESLKNLGKSIESHGLLQPIIVRPREGYYELVVGERRLRAAKLMGMDEIEARIEDLDDATCMELRLIENTHREDLTEAEKGDAIWILREKYPEKYPNIKSVANSMNTPYATVMRWIEKSRKLSPIVNESIRSDKLSEYHARFLLKYDHPTQNKLVYAIVSNEVPSTVMPNFIKLYDANPDADLDDLANKAKGVKRVEVEVEKLSGEARKEIEKVLEERSKEAEEARKRALEKARKAPKRKPKTTQRRIAPLPRTPLFARASQLPEVSKLRTEEPRPEEKLQEKLDAFRDRIAEIEPSQRNEVAEKASRQIDTAMRRVFPKKKKPSPLDIRWSRLFCGTINNLSGAREGNITHNRIRFFAKTPPEIVCPHFWELVWATGCAFRPACAWCYLQGTFRGNITPRFFDKQELKKQLEAWFDGIESLSCQLINRPSSPQILVTGELADSLMGEEYWKSKYGVPFSKWITELFEKQNKHKVLFLTKSDRVENLLDINPHNQAVVSFSLNAEAVAKRWEKGAYIVSPIKNRIEMAGRLQQNGYEVRIRIDPMVPILDWENQYKRLVDDIFSTFTPEKITIGSLRGLESTIRFCEDRSWVDFLSKEKTGWGRKIPDDQRQVMYSTLISYLKDKYNYLHIALCKETEIIWKRLDMDPGMYPYWSGCKCNCVR